MPTYLVTADPIRTFQPRFDTTLRILAELRRRGEAVDFCDLTETDPSLPADRFLGELPVRAVLACDPSTPPFVELGPPRRGRAGEYEVLIHRKDPPVDARYRGYMGPFVHVPRDILQINDPAAVLAHSEHTLQCEFPEYAVPTTICEDLGAFVAAVRAQPGEAVAKPLAECSGIGIHFFPADAPEAELAAWWARFGGSAVVQPFQAAIHERGDLRILVMNQRILGAVTRLPRAGSRLANLHQGASARAFEPTPRQREAVRAVAAALAPRGLHLLGLDFIGDLLSEINFTSPSALVQINEVMHQRTEALLVDEIEALRGGRRGQGAGSAAGE